MPGESGEDPPDADEESAAGSPISRRRVLTAGAAVGAAGVAGAYAVGRRDGDSSDGRDGSDGGGDGTGGGDATSTPDPTTEPVRDGRARELAERYAPDLYFGRRERWFPTDPRRYESERDGRTVVDGFDALDGYTREFRETGRPPAPTVCYHVVEYPEAPLVAVQYWLYSAFDQFTTNFHWHDWELLQVFVDTDAGRPVLYAASAHSRRVPNNEFVDPDAARPAIVSEVGSHSSALGVNARRDSFQRFPVDGLPADITNRAIRVANAVEAIPAAYGLPRDEGFRLPYAVPELDGAPLYEHDRLPSVRAADLLPSELTVRSFGALSDPPTDLPARETGERWAHAGVEAADADRRYDLVPIDDLRGIDAFTGPQLSFEFAVPAFAEDAVAKHITAAGVPWTQERFTAPTADVTDPRHRETLADRYAGIEATGPVEQVVGVLREASEAADAPDGEGIATVAPTVEGVCLLESDPVAVPTWRGRVAVRDVAAGEHRLTVNAPGVAPYAERLSVEEGTGRAGVDGAVTVVPNARAVKVRGDAGDRSIARVRLADDFGGRVYDAPPDDDGRFAVYAHEGGAYTVEVRDEDGVPGAFRVNPDPGQGRATVENVRTGKAPMATFVRDLLAETRDRARGYLDGESTGTDGTSTATPADGTDEDATTETATATPTTDGKPAARPSGGLLTGLTNALAAAERAVEAAEAGDGPGANRRLEAVARRLGGLRTALDANRDRLDSAQVRLFERRLDLLDRRISEAIETPTT
ncbi:MAG: hypothetical protein ABEJ61_00600 [Haloferacaceae archaeon]